MLLSSAPGANGKGTRAKTEAAAYKKLNDGLLPKNFRKRRQNRKREGGFALGVILYMLAMVGVGAGVLFSGHSQILRSNIQITNQNAAKNDLSGTATTLAATAELSGDSTLFCPAQHT
jgi:hypothetical protein